MAWVIFWDALYIWAVSSSAYKAIHGDRIAVWFLVLFASLFALNRILDDAIKYLDGKIAEYER